ncbi:probable bifunctional P-450:NADPH-P450 reductase [Fusarium fujikuroi IMI 58289]|uniref:Bifunctional cytochrome P450/NADPH--P450 reductase n=1 Tax=Gibberella fujikuroi (strain CBS 195.34 / IMI 58289 / NRRL A-6831) TaxID=1279085 RepID=S0EA49_GIBF5|nr:probable bifunctional P-450:NADPH-P450 reductase [Fusarium fujikuroi IMI 58289]KLP09058.1 putative NADPH reductase [Fusarium fujikuroi]KLP21544.1 putative NADPH reductase [Fusarium fujikuroi]CCT71791.1 probable bifunctional P-450:NADPH-P450 reductase [Fusarium fujikuroi IMI 58289]SCO20821.1 probable bifunctional P-450:NADPH-P450 reductase [Fusarium fujikuroi]SCO22511.1 probable bifunctional P-450:NADPH-P450 reductase [Fusarium fujikuroi]
MSKQIPSPKGYPFIGNVLDVNPDHPQESLTQIAESYGPIFRLYLPAERIFVANYALAKDLFDEARFEKAVTGPLEQVRNATKDGLFTAYPGEHNWEIAHRTLMPAFGPLSIQSMFGEMQDIISQMVLRWARFGPRTPVDVSNDFTKLTLDSIALCAMGERFNSFYHDDTHPFVGAMNSMLAESFARSRRPAFASAVMTASNERYQSNIAELEGISRELLETRRQNPVDKKDLLNAMINGRDPKTGEGLDDDAIIRNMITFLIAGHETTSGLLSFLFYQLLENPSALRQVVEEVDRVLGSQPMTVAHLAKLPYIDACLKETLRLYPTAPAFTLRAKGDQVLNSEYTIKDKDCVSILLARLHRDPDVYGPDAEEFNPSRMLPDKFNKLPPNAWKPFGHGVRACIGRPFAIQEAIMATATILQTFHITKDNPSYQLQIRTALTIKPQGFNIRTRLRNSSFLQGVELSHGSSSGTAASSKTPSRSHAVREGNSEPISILYGSNTGTCEALAQSLASFAEENGYVPKVDSLDNAISSLKPDVPVVVITGSYEGQPPDNASHFVEWLASLSSGGLIKVPYAVFGVGNEEWHATYQRIQSLIVEQLEKAGATRLVTRAAVDVAKNNCLDAIEEWQEREFWPALQKQSGKSSNTASGGARELKLDISIGLRPSILRQDVMTAQISTMRLLSKPGAPRKRHIGIILPSGTTYRAGDYLAVLPLNHPDVVHRVMRRFNLPWDATVVIDGSKSTSLPTDQPLSVQNLLAGMVELGQPVTERQAQQLVETIPDKTKSDELKERVNQGNIHKLNTTLLDLLEDYPSATYSFGQYLAALPALHLRQYSISSSPIASPSPSECSLTYSVIDAPARGSSQGHRYLGVASTYVERLQPGDHLQVGVRPSRSGFHLPIDNKTPIVMACAGTGLAPFYGFVAERAVKKRQGLDVGTALLFYGCNDPDEDDLYRQQFDEWEHEGVVKLYRAYTFASKKSENCKFVQDRMWFDRKDIVASFRQGAQIYICGAGIVGSSIQKVLVKIKAEVADCDEETAAEWVDSMKGERYWADVFA